MTSEKKGVRPLACYVALLVALCTWTSGARADVPKEFSLQIDQINNEATRERPAKFTWSSDRRLVAVDFRFHDLITAGIQRKLRRGLPTQILLLGALITDGSSNPVSAVFQDCKVTWHVWEEMYRVELQRSSEGSVRKVWTPTLRGVLRRCAQTNRLIVADRSQVPSNSRLRLVGVVSINPVSDKLHARLRGWLSRPARSARRDAGGALFSAFTALFIRRIGDAEHSLPFRTRQLVPESKPQAASN